MASTLAVRPMTARCGEDPDLPSGSGPGSAYTDELSTALSTAMRTVLAGLVPAIHASGRPCGGGKTREPANRRRSNRRLGVDSRHKAGQDGQVSHGEREISRAVAPDAQARAHR